MISFLYSGFDFLFFWFCFTRNSGDRPSSSSREPSNKSLRCFRMNNSKTKHYSWNWAASCCCCSIIHYRLTGEPIGHPSLSPLLIARQHIPDGCFTRFPYVTSLHHDSIRYLTRTHTQKEKFRREKFQKNYSNFFFSASKGGGDHGTCLRNNII